MYNDYYLEQINNKLSVVNNKLDSIIDQNNITNQYLLSGDTYLLNYTKDFYQFSFSYFTGFLFLLIFVCTILFYDFYHHLFGRR